MPLQKYWMCKSYITNLVEFYHQANSDRVHPLMVLCVCTMNFTLKFFSVQVERRKINFYLDSLWSRNSFGASIILVNLYILYVRQHLKWHTPIWTVTKKKKHFTRSLIIIYLLLLFICIQRPKINSKTIQR